MGTACNDHLGSVFVVHTVRWSLGKGLILGDRLPVQQGSSSGYEVGKGVRFSSPLPRFLPAQPSHAGACRKGLPGRPAMQCDGWMNTDHEVERGLHVTRPEGSPTWRDSPLWRPYLKEGHSH